MSGFEECDAYCEGKAGKKYKVFQANPVDSCEKTIAERKSIKHILNVQVPYDYPHSRNPHHQRITPEEWMFKYNESKSAKEQAAADMRQLNKHLEKVVDDSYNYSKDYKRLVDEKLADHVLETVAHRKNLELILAQLEKLFEDLRKIINKCNKFIERLNRMKHIAETCLYFREQRPPIELVNDAVEDLLFQEITTAHRMIEKFTKLLHTAAQNYDSTHDAIEAVKRDSFLKSQSYQIDEALRNKNKFSYDVNYCPPSGKITSTFASWNGKTGENLKISQDILQQTGDFVKNLDKDIDNTADELGILWKKTTDEFHNNIANLLKSSHLARQALSETMEQISSMNDKCDKLDQDIRDKRRMMALATTRLCGQDKRPEIENTADVSNLTLKQQIQDESSLADKIASEKTGVFQVCLNLEEVKRNLEVSVGSKELALHIDRHQCLQMRQAWPNGPFRPTDYVRL